MGTVIYCDRARHRVTDHTEDIARAIRAVEDAAETGTPLSPSGVNGFIAVSPASGPQVWLRAAAITSFFPDPEAPEQGKDYGNPQQVVAPALR